MRTWKKTCLAVLVLSFAAVLGGCEDKDAHSIQIKAKDGQIDVKTK